MKQRLFLKKKILPTLHQEPLCLDCMYDKYQSGQTVNLHFPNGDSRNINTTSNLYRNLYDKNLINSYDQNTDTYITSPLREVEIIGEKSKLMSKDGEANLPSPQKIHFWNSWRNSGLNDYSKFPNFNTAFRNSREKGEKKFVYKNKTYNTNLIPKEQSDQYWDSKKFLDDYYSNNKLDKQIDTSGYEIESLWDEYTKEKYGYTWVEYFDSIKNSPDYTGKDWTDKQQKIYNRLDELDYSIYNSTGKISNKYETDKDFQKFINKIYEKTGNEYKSRLHNKDYYFSITNQKPKDLAADGYVDKTNKKIFLSSAPEKNGALNTVFVHELAHKAQDPNITWNTTPLLKINLLNKEKNPMGISQELIDYASNPNEVEARRMSTLYYLSKNNIDFRNIKKENLDNLYLNKEKLPYDIKQLLDLYYLQQDDLLNYLNGNFNKYKSMDDLEEDFPKNQSGSINTNHNYTYNWGSNTPVKPATDYGTTVHKSDLIAAQQKADNIGVQADKILQMKPIGSSNSYVSWYKSLTPQELSILKQSKYKSKLEPIEAEIRIADSNEANKQGFVAGLKDPELMRRQTQAIGDKLDIPFIPNVVDSGKFIGDIASGLGAVPSNIQQGNYGSAAMSVVLPLIVGGLSGWGVKSTGQFVNNLVNPLAGTRVVDNLGNKYLPNTHLVNPWSWKPKPNSFYRQVDKETFNEGIESGLIKGKQNINTDFDPGKISLNKAFGDDAYYNKGSLYYKDTNNQPYLFEANLPEDYFIPKVNGRTRNLTQDNTSVRVSKEPISIDNPNINIYEKNWLKGYKQIEVPKSNFKSEIDWAKWNKEIPENKSLMDEYNTIEQQTKANNTWMKNPDGSTFKGTAEQFVQQNSKNFKKAFPNPIINEFGSIQVNYHGSPYKINEFKGDNMINGRIYGEGLYTTPTKTLAQSYAKGDNPQLYELYLNANNKRNASSYVKDGVRIADEKLDNIELKFGKNSKEYNQGLIDYDNALEEIRKNRTKILPNEDFMNIKDIQVTPFSNYPKSAINNNGMFDMTNPNIYKGLIPLGGVITLQNKNQTGDIVPDETWVSNGYAQYPQWYQSTKKSPDDTYQKWMLNNIIEDMYSRGITDVNEIMSLLNNISGYGTNERDMRSVSNPSLPFDRGDLDGMEDNVYNRFLKTALDHRKVAKSYYSRNQTGVNYTATDSPMSNQHPAYTVEPNNKNQLPSGTINTLWGFNRMWDLNNPGKNFEKQYDKEFGENQLYKNPTTGEVTGYLPEIQVSAISRTTEDKIDNIWNESMQFHKDWINSPMYKELASNSGNEKKISNRRLKRLEGVNYQIEPEHKDLLGKSTVDGYYKWQPFDKNKIVVSNRGDWGDIKSTIVHELGHATDLWGHINDMPRKDKQLIKQLSKEYSQENEYKDPRYSNYVKDPTETRARLLTIRKALLDNGVDVFKTKITEKILEDNLPIFDKSGFTDLRAAFKKKDIVKMLNSISDNSNSIYTKNNNIS